MCTSHSEGSFLSKTPTQTKLLILVVYGNLHWDSTTAFPTYSRMNLYDFCVDANETERAASGLPQELTSLIAVKVMGISGIPGAQAGGRYRKTRWLRSSPKRKMRVLSV